MEVQNTRTSEARPKRKEKKQNTPRTSKTLRIRPWPHFFSALCDFFLIFLDCTKGSPFFYFDILQHNGCQKIPKGPPFYIFRHCDTVQKSHFLKSFGKFFKVKGSPLLQFSALDIAPTLAVLGLLALIEFNKKQQQNQGSRFCENKNCQKTKCFKKLSVRISSSNITRVSEISFFHGLTLKPGLWSIYGISSAKI